MPRQKKDPRKLYKATKKVINEQEYLCVRYKNLRPIDVRELRAEINLLITDFFVQAEPAHEKKQVKFEECEKCSR